MNRSRSARSESPSSFWLKRLMSLLGIAPIGIFVVLHLWTNMSSLGGPQAFDAALVESRRHPAFLALELLLGLAILIHMVVGLALIRWWRPSIPGSDAWASQRTFTNLKFVLQRITAIGIGLFIIAHVIEARILPAWSPQGRESWLGMREALSEPVTLSVYVLGLLGVSYHLANGLWTSLITWGVVVTPRQQRQAQWVSAAVLVVLLAMSGLSIYGFLGVPAAHE